MTEVLQRLRREEGDVAQSVALAETALPLLQGRYEECRSLLAAARQWTSDLGELSSRCLAS